jgi:Protein phosphatase 2C
LVSHIRAGKGCDDFGACFEVAGNHDSILIAVVSDGAGSACHSAKGSWITSRVFAETASRFIKSGQQLTDLSFDLARGWLDDIRDRIIVAARKQGASPRDFAATLVGSLVAAEHAIFIHVGDGGFVFRSTKSEAPGWSVASWPQQGEYASTTFFVTDDPEPNCRFLVVEESVDELAVFSDGIEHLVLDFTAHTAFAPFFDKMFVPLSGTDTGRDRVLSRKLRQFLDGPSVCAKTDDDKTLILAKRLSRS